jgi:hypothetical protein
MEQGLLTGALDPERTFPEGDMRKNDAKFSRENRIEVGGALKKFEPIARRHGASVCQAVENAQAGYLRLTPEEVEELNRIVERELRLD